MASKKDITNQRFGRLVALSVSGRDERNGDLMWRCQCDCGNIVNVDGARLRSGATRSCGCLRRETSRRSSRQNDQFIAQIGDASSLKTVDGISLASIRMSHRNKSGMIGVSYDKETNKWLARLMVNGRYVLLKSFDTRNEACEARQMAEQMYHVKRQEAVEG